MPRAAYYARTSTEKQKDEATIESQVDDIEKRIKADNNDLPPQNEFKDEGWSGEMPERPALDRMRDAARRHEFDILYIYDRGRLARKFSIQELIIDELTDLEIKVISLHDINAVTAEERVLQSMQGVFHEYERVKIAERMRRGKLFKTRSGNLLGYNPPFGYDYIHKTKEKNGYFVINETEAEIVKKIFDWVGNKELTIHRVIAELHRLKIMPPKNKRRIWVNSTLVRMLRNESYAGRHYYLKSQSAIPKNPKKNNGYKRLKKSSRIVRPKEDWIPIEVPKIIDGALFDKVQQQLKVNIQDCRRNKKREYLLSGRAYCTCGAKRCGEPSSKHLYYRCAKRIYNYPLPSDCSEKGVNAKVLDILVWHEIKKLLTNKRTVKAQTVKWLKSHGERPDTTQIELNRLTATLQKLGEEEKRYLQAFGQGISSIEAYQDQMRNLNLRKESITTQIRDLKKSSEAHDTPPPTLTVDRACEIAESFVKKIDFNDKLIVIRKIISKVVANQKEATIYGRIPLEVNTEKVGLNAINWNRWPTECRQKYYF